VRNDSRREAITAALNGLPDVPALGWDKSHIVHIKDGVYVVRVSRAAPAGRRWKRSRYV
jgi:hypothetical protein